MPTVDRPRPAEWRFCVRPLLLALNQLEVLLPTREQELFRYAMDGGDISKFPLPSYKRQAMLGRIRKRIEEYCGHEHRMEFERHLVGYRCRILSVEIPLEPLRVLVSESFAEQHPELISETDGCLANRLRAARRREQMAA